jgi:hypothetical protein
MIAMREEASMQGFKQRDHLPPDEMLARRERVPGMASGREYRREPGCLPDRVPVTIG